jgi:hypothetical protein
MANFALEAYKLGARFIGGCCGTAPYHIRSMAEALGRKVAASKYSPVELTEEQSSQMCRSAVQFLYKLKIS